MQNRNERSAGARSDDSPRDESGASTSPGVQRDRYRSAQPWGISFVLFVLGCMLLVVLAKLNLSRLTTDVLRGVAAGPCVAAFVIGRRGQRVTR